MLVGSSFGLRIRTLDLTCGPTEPGFETRLAESRVIAGNECPLAQLHAVIARGLVSDNTTTFAIPVRRYRRP